MRAITPMSFEEWLEANKDLVDAGDEPCTECKGKGSIKCGDCDGTGTTECPHYHNDSDCETCEGDGVEECESCKGRGSLDTAKRIYQEQLEADKARLRRLGLTAEITVHA